MKVLIYNWCPLYSKEGGGVSVYVKNILSTLKDRCEVIFLNSGFYFDNSGHPYIRKSEQVEQGIVSFDLVNSPVMAPMKSPMENVEQFLYSKEITDLFVDFVLDQRFDAIHFNSFEGLTLDAVRTKDRMGNVRYIYSIHNYALFCPCVNLWTSNNSNCFTEPEKCAACMAKYQWPTMPQKKRFRARKDPNLYYFGRVETHMLNDASKLCNFGFGKNERASFIYDKYRAEQVKTINDYFDVVLPVSKRVGDIAAYYGISRSLLHTEYIGSKFADKQESPRTPANDNVLRIVFLGYMKYEKGLPFLVEALSECDAGVRGRISLTVAAKLQDVGVFAALKRLEPSLHSLQYYNGYTHDQMSRILEGQELGVVPVLWEDNLPQIAIELAAQGIPVLASSFGGPSELTESDLFKFNGGDVKDFNLHLERFLNDKSLLANYWTKRLTLPSVAQHVDCLLGYYEGAELQGDGK